MENNGKGIFYGVIGVATLIVAIIGATFAYFTATNSNNSTINGTAATAGLDLTVTLESSNATGNMIPQLGSTIGSALNTTTTDQCVDSNGNTVCKLYKITVANTGSAAAVVNGTLDLAVPSTMTNLKWALVTYDKDAATKWSAGTVGDAGTGKAIASNVSLTASSTTVTTDEATYYVVVFIGETSAAQTDSGSFTGTVTFNAADGSGVTSTFTS